MGPKQAWIGFSLLVALSAMVAMVALVNMGHPQMVVVTSGLVFLLLYFYVIYKRYHVEVIRESDLKLFTDPDDLRILCRIYGLDAEGSQADLKERLIAFSRENSRRAFAWIAPRSVRSVTAALEIPEYPQEGDDQLETKPLTGGRTRSESRLAAIGRCPVCDANLSGRDRICSECGADLEFYAVLRESKVGRQLVSEKKVVRRKTRYEGPTSGDTR